MQLEEFNALAKQGFNRIPLVKEVLADLETPLSLYVKLSQAFGKKKYLPFGISSWRRAVWALLLYWPARQNHYSYRRDSYQPHQ